METQNEIGHELRKLRKKLRQIEILEDIGRELTFEEKAKVSKKVTIRKDVQKLLAAKAELDAIKKDELSATQVRSDVVALHIVSTSPKTDITGIQKNEANQTDLTEIQTNEASQTEIDELDVGSVTGNNDEVADTVKDSTSNVESTNVRKSSEKDSGVSASKDKIHNERKRWRSAAWTVTQLVGHSDLVVCMDTAADLLLTGSRDTTVKLWNVTTGDLLLNCGGHTDTVTGVTFIPSHAAAQIASAIDSDETVLSGPMAVSASLDCTLKIWSFTTGHCLKSTYAFNPLTCLCYLPAAEGVVVGTGGGKVEIRSLTSGEAVYSSLEFGDRVSSIQVRESLVYGGCVDGTVKVWRWEAGQLTGVFVTGDTPLSLSGGQGHELSLRAIKSILPLGDNNVVIGDDGLSIKIIDWKFGHVTKLANHTHDFGATDALWANSDILLSSGYDIDCGVGYINVRSQPSLRYVCTLYDEGQGRVLVVKCCTIGEHLVIVTGGRELRVYTPVHGGDRDVIYARVLAEYARPVTRQSDGEEDNDVTEAALTDSQSDDDIDATPTASNAPPPSRSWCHVL